MRATITPNATSSATKNQVMPPRQPSARVRAGKARLALLEERADAFAAFRTDGVRGDGLALEHHLRLEGAERVRDQSLGGAERGACALRQLFGQLQRARQQRLVSDHLVHQPPA